MSQFLMPSLGADMEAGTLVEWLKQPGDAVAHGDIIAVVETQKGAIEIEVFEDGVLRRHLVAEGTKVPVGTPLALIGGEEETVETPEPQPPAVAPPPLEPEHGERAASPPQPASPSSAPAVGGRPRITQAARKLAAETGVDITTLVPSNGRAITRADVLAAQSQAAAPEPLSAMRSAIAAAMTRSKREIPHYYLSHSADVTDAEEFVSEANADRAPENRLLIIALWIRAVAKALHKFPEFNGHLEKGEFRPSAPVHAGVAINIRGGGLVAPAIHNTESRKLEDVMAAVRDLATRVRAGRFRGTELSDPTITLTSLGDRGVERLYGVIYPPQVAIVGIGSPQDRAWVVEGKVVPRRIVELTLAADHRVSDGHRGALFLRAIEKHMTFPKEL